MIRVTRLNGESFLVNAELIKYVEERPDTFLTLATNDRVVVRETMDQVLAKVMEYQRGKGLLPSAAPESPRQETAPASGVGRRGNAASGGE